jgi:hypothetical protein
VLTSVDPDEFEKWQSRPSLKNALWVARLLRCVYNRAVDSRPGKPRSIGFGVFVRYIIPEKAIARREWRATCPLSSAQRNPKNAFSKAQALSGRHGADGPERAAKAIGPA